MRFRRLDRYPVRDGQNASKIWTPLGCFRNSESGASVGGATSYCELGCPAPFGPARVGYRALRAGGPGLWTLLAFECRKYDGTPPWLRTSWMIPQQMTARRRTSAYRQEVPISCIKAESSGPIGRAPNRFFPNGSAVRLLSLDVRGSKENEVQSPVPWPIPRPYLR